MDSAKAARSKLKNCLNNAKNFQIQSLSASIVNRAAIAINRYLKSNNIDGLVIAQIHDQLIVKVPSSQASQVAPIVRQLMEGAFKLSIPLVAPAEIGTNFADAH
jgi:DNA polymerase-1